MENNTQIQKRNYSLPLSIVTAAVILAFVWIYTTGLKVNTEESKKPSPTVASEEPAAQTAAIPLVWGDLGMKMAEAGVFDKTRLLALYAERGGLGVEDQKLIDGIVNEPLKVSAKNAGLLLNLLWAFGLSNENEILTSGPMMDPRYGGANRFASTGGWTLAKGPSTGGGQANPMDHYSKHRFVTLTIDEQALVERVAKNIYRPCCDNSTYFPDCNHGMAMLGLLELLASQGATEAQMYRAALVMNSYWFPDEYATIARYFESKDITPQSVDPKEILGAAYSRGSGFSRIASLVPKEIEERPSGGCGV